MEPNVQGQLHSVQGRLVERVLEHRNTPGAFGFSQQQDRLVFVCPCGCGDIAGVTLQPQHKDGWEWDGNISHPTLKPSVHKVSGCGWHGYLTAGLWVRVQ